MRSGHIVCLCLWSVIALQGWAAAEPLSSILGPTMHRPTRQIS